MSLPGSGEQPDFADTVRGYWDRLETANSPFMGLLVCGNGGGVEAHYRHAEELRTFLSLVPIRKGLRVLELGCGNGRWIMSLAPRVAYYEGFDFSEVMVAQARELADRNRLHNVKITQANVESYRPDSMFDVIYVSGVSLYIRDAKLKEVFERMRAHLNPGGLLVERSTFDRRARETIPYRESDRYAAIYRTAPELIAIAESAGFALQAREESYVYMNLPSKVVEFLNRPPVRRSVRAAAPLSYPILRRWSAAVSARQGNPTDMNVQSHEFMTFTAR